MYYLYFMKQLKQNTMKSIIKQIELRISELEQAQQIEVNNNFANGDLWNDLEDKINNLKNHGQENNPEPIIINGLKEGYKLNDGTEIIFGDMFNSHLL
jgi:hypothetical protein